MAPPLLEAQGLIKEYRQRRFGPPSFRLEAELRLDGPAIVGIMGPNGSGKTTLFELITGSNRPTAGRVLCSGIDIHEVRPKERDRLAIHYHQAYQVRRFRSLKPSFLMRRAPGDYPLVHLFDEPQFSLQDGYIGFMLSFFRRLRGEGRLVFVCLHPNEPFHLQILEEICERFFFIHKGRLSEAPDLAGLLADERVRAYLGGLVADRHGGPAATGRG
jgi:ABC-type multidrug transport system ATPase subunit